MLRRRTATRTPVSTLISATSRCPPATPRDPRNGFSSTTTIVRAGSILLAWQWLRAAVVCALSRRHQMGLVRSPTLTAARLRPCREPGPPPAA